MVGCFRKGVKREEKESPKIKICGITAPEEAEYLNQAKVDYAGFVFYEKSKRNVTFSQAEEIQRFLSPHIKRVAVAVSPDIGFCQQIEAAGFDILQIHGQLDTEVLEAAVLPIWRACNIGFIEELQQLKDHEKIAAYVVDAPSAGSGRTFRWQSAQATFRQKKAFFYGKPFVLAGGLNAQNVQEGIQLFRPDIVDVSSGVENDSGKDSQLIFEFVDKARQAQLYSEATM